MDRLSPMSRTKFDGTDQARRDELLASRGEDVVGEARGLTPGSDPQWPPGA